MRKLCVFGVAIVAALSGSRAPQAQTAATNQRVWMGTWEESDSWQGRNKFGRSQAQISYVYVQSRDEFGGWRWESRRLTWSAVFEDTIFDHLLIEPVGSPDERGTIQNRYPVDSVTLCTTSGTLELGPAVQGSGDELTAAQKSQLLGTSVTTYQSRDGSVPAPPSTSTGTCDLLQVLGMPNEDELVGCSYEKSWPKGGRPAGSFSVSVSAPLAAVMEVDPTGDYGRFVPVPGQTLTFLASVPGGTARFRFELDPVTTSRFPGYATNANVDDLFFMKYGLAHLRNQYADDSPDLIFDEAKFDAADWARIEPLVVETATASSFAAVSVTAMDYGAVGRFRAFAKSGDCGDWQPVTIRVGDQVRDFVSIPLDEDDNLMADAREEYRGKASGVDDDAEPAGNGMGGDGLTAFEEYRGFMTRGAGCGTEPTEPVYFEPQVQNQSQITGWSDEHMRTNPGRKDLFVHTPDPELALAVPAFAAATDLSVHLICEPHYVSNDARRVNFTLHDAGLRSWRSRAVAREEPQRGIFLERVDFLGRRGLAIPVVEGQIGPPKLTRTVQVEKPRSREAARAGSIGPFGDLVHVVVHELGHAVGIPHHGDKVDNWRLVLGPQNIQKWLSLQQHAGGPPDFTQPDSLPECVGCRYAPVEGRYYLQSLLVEPGAGCVEGAEDAVYYRDGQFAGCSADSIARRGQQNSGDFECPMRYSGSDYYEAPGMIAQFRWTGLVSYRFRNRNEGSFRDEPGNLVDAWAGKFLKYRNDLDRDGTGKFCSQISGTGINNLPGDMNHAGDAGRDKACNEFIVVNDLAAQGLP